MYDRYHKPLFILENGIGMIETLNEENTVHDDYRIAYLEEHLRALKLAINDGCDIRGYTWWGPIDVVSLTQVKCQSAMVLSMWIRMMKARVRTNVIKKDNYYYYKHIIETDGDEL